MHPSVRWEQIQSIFHEALSRPDGDERRAFVVTACAGDIELEDEVESLLAEDSRHTSLLSVPSGETAARLLNTPPPILPRIGPYRLVNLAGRGGMGMVYLAERDDLGSRAAIKILPNAWMSAARRERFLWEQRALSRLNHPSIARLYDAGLLEDGTPWFAMEWVDGEPLTAYCRNHACALPERLRLFRQVAEAVRYAHQQAILHRDLKPSNILVKAGGQVSGEVRLLDFGIAKSLDPDAGDASLTQTGAALLTPTYAAPEQARGEAATVQADVYSLGAILYELLAGEPHLDLTGKGAAEALALVEGAEARPPSAAASRLSGVSRSAWQDLDVLCLTALHRDRTRRYATVEALLRDLDRFERQQPLDARPDDFAYRLRKYVTRHRAGLLATASAAALLVAMAGYFTWRLTAARDTAIAEAARTRRIQQFIIDLFQGGDREAGPAQDLRVTTLLDRGARGARMLAADAESQSDLLQTLGDIYLQLGKHDQASELLHAALAGRKGLAKPAPALVVESLASLSLLCIDQGKLDDAGQLARQALDLATRTLPAGHPRIAAAMLAVGRVQVARAEYQQAIATLEQALRLREQNGAAAPDQSTASILVQLANAHHYSGHYDQSEALNRRVFEIYSRLYGVDHPLLVDPLINLGAIAHQRAQYLEAERHYRRAAEINRAYHGPDHPFTADSLRGLADALTYQKRYSESIPILRQVVAARERTYGPVHLAVANAIMSLAVAHRSAGHLAEAEQLLRRTIQILEKSEGQNHLHLGVAITNLGAVYMDRQEFARAEETFRRAIARLAAGLPADHRDLAIARVRLGRALLRQDRLAEAGTETAAGVAVLERTAPNSSWTTGARADLAEIAKRSSAAGLPR